MMMMMMVIVSMMIIMPGQGVCEAQCRRCVQSGPQHHAHRGPHRGAGDDDDDKDDDNYDNDDDDNNNDDNDDVVQLALAEAQSQLPHTARAAVSGIMADPELPQVSDDNDDDDDMMMIMMIMMMLMILHLRTPALPSGGR